MTPPVLATRPGQDFLRKALYYEAGPGEIQAIVGVPWADSIRKAAAAAQETYRKRREKR